jgi:hypothetical protein
MVYCSLQNAIYIFLRTTWQRLGRVHVGVGCCWRSELCLPKRPRLTPNRPLTNDPKLPRRTQNANPRRAAQRPLQPTELQIQYLPQPKPDSGSVWFVWVLGAAGDLICVQPTDRPFTSAFR